MASSRSSWKDIEKDFPRISTTPRGCTDLHNVMQQPLKLLQDFARIFTRCPHKCQDLQIRTSKNGTMKLLQDHHKRAFQRTPKRSFCQDLWESAMSTTPQREQAQGAQSDERVARAISKYVTRTKWREGRTNAWYDFTKYCAHRETWKLTLTSQSFIPGL